MSTDNPLTDGHLSLWDLSSLEAAEAIANRSDVKALHIGAHLYSAVPLAALLERLSVFDNVRLIRLADDRTPDLDMPQVKAEFNLVFPDAKFEWTWDGLVAGKHGR